ncbi:MAG: FecR family protein [Cyclobacteriaceae bacterium]
MKYSNYNIDDYLRDKDFVHWVKNPDGPHSVFWKAWVESNPDHAQRIQEAQSIISSMKVHAFEPTSKDYEEVMSRILSYKKPERNILGYTTWDKTSNWGSFWRVAAILLLAFSISLVLFEFNAHTVMPTQEIASSTTTRHNQNQLRSHFKLPDGTKVWLNTQSKIEYNEFLESESREVSLKGEAFFEIAKDSLRPFIVKAGGISIQALGTSFNVNSSEIHEPEVALLTGSVEVWHSHDEAKVSKIMLLPGELLKKKSTSHTFKVSHFNTLKVTGWKDGILHFESAGFDEVKSRIENWYGVQVVTNDKPQKSWNYTGTFTNSSLERVLERISFTKGFNYTIIDDVVHINI